MKAKLLSDNESIGWERRDYKQARPAGHCGQISRKGAVERGGRGQEAVIEQIKKRYFLSIVESRCDSARRSHCEQLAAPRSTRSAGKNLNRAFRSPNNLGGSGRGPIAEHPVTHHWQGLRFSKSYEVIMSH